MLLPSDALVMDSAAKFVVAHVMTLIDWMLVAWAGTMMVAVGVVWWRVIRRPDLRERD
jgi:hypothetical protein